MKTETLNAVLAGVVFCLAIGTANRMNGKTSWSIRVALLVILIGMLGQSIGYFAGKWDHYCDTLLYAGIGAFLLACRRNPVGFPWPWNEIASYALSGSAAAFIVA